VVGFHAQPVHHFIFFKQAKRKDESNLNPDKPGSGEVQRQGLRKVGVPFGVKKPKFPTFAQKHYRALFPPETNK
jgi:hypothetical protein